MTEPRQYLGGRPRVAQETVRVFEEWQRQHGHPPTVRDMRDALGVGSTHTAYVRMIQAARRGWLEHRRGRFPAFISVHAMEAQQASAKIELIRRACHAVAPAIRARELARTVLTIIED